MGYLDTLADKTVSAYNHIAEGVPGVADDPTLVAMFVAFNPDWMPISFFKEQIMSQTNRYMASNAANIGRKYRRPTRTPTQTMYDGGADYETRVAWVVDRGKSRLAYVDREFLVRFAYDDDAYIGPKAKSLATRPKDRDIQRVESTEDSDKFIAYVEEELIEISLAKHKALWAEEVKSYQLAVDQDGKPVLFERKMGPNTK